MFSAAASSEKRELVLRRDTLTDKAARAIEDGSDASLFEITSLNTLHLSGFNQLRPLSRVGDLSALLQLSLPENHLEVIPEEVGSLQRLRLLDLSRNSISSLPTSLFQLPALQTFLLSHNALTDSSFPPDLPAPVLPSLHQLDLVGNQLTSLPVFIAHTPHLNELRVAHNSLSSLDPTLIQTMANLRLLEAHNNQLDTLPHQLASCSKLKSIQLEANPLKDRRLLKLVEQHGRHKPKAVLDYLASRAPQPSQEEGGGKKKKKKGKGKLVQMLPESEDSDVEFSDKPPVVTVVRPERGRGVEVVATNDARKVRPYLVCTVLRGLCLDRQNALREFLSLQVMSQPPPPTRHYCYILCVD